MPVQKGMQRPLAAASRAIQPCQQPERAFGHPDRTRRVDEIIDGREHPEEHRGRQRSMATGMAQNPNPENAYNWLPTTANPATPTTTKT